MQMINDFIDEIKNRLWETHLRITKLQQVVPKNIGCIVFKGKYMYWQVFENGHRIQHYIPIREQENAQKKMEISHHQKQTLKELTQFYTKLESVAQVFELNPQDILKEFDLAYSEQKPRSISRQKAIETTAKKAHAEHYQFMSDKGDQVASKSELIIANTLFASDVQYSYEEPIEIDGRTIKPDFTIWRPDGTKVLWEHAGLLDKPGYAKSFSWKLAQYEKAGFDRSDTLIVTREKDFSAFTVRRLIASYELI